MYNQQAARLATHHCRCGEKAVAWEYDCPACLVKRNRTWADRVPHDLGIPRVAAENLCTLPLPPKYLLGRAAAVSPQDGGAGAGVVASRKAGANP